MGDALVDSRSDKLRRAIVRGMQKYHLPGVAAGVVRGDGLVWSEGFGYADVASERRPDQDTVFRVASISKTFTATAVMQLRDAGKLRLDDPLVRHIPEFASVRCQHGPVEDITIRRLLCHHSGLITEGPFEYWATMDFPTMAEILAKLPDTDAVIAPDSASKYGNLAYALLGEVVARLSGRTFEDYAREELFAPLGMTSSSFVSTPDLLARKATGYDEHAFEDDPPIVRHTETHGIAPAAGLYTTVADLARWITFQFKVDGGEREGAQVLTGRTLTEMHHPQHVDPTWTMGNGLGWFSSRRGERIDVGHGGSIHGFITQISFNVPRKLGVILLTNEGRHQGAGEIAIEMMDMLAKAHDDAGGADQDVKKPVPTPAAWKPLLGRYRAWGTDVQIECREGKLRFEPFPPGGRSAHAPSPLEPTADPHVFRVAEGRAAGELLSFRLGTDGTATGFTVAGFPYTRMVPAG